MTHTFATLDVSPACYEEIKQRLALVNYHHAFTESDGQPVIDMHGIALKREVDGRVQVYIVFDGKRLKPPKEAPK